MPATAAPTGRLPDWLGDLSDRPVDAIREGFPYAFYERLLGKLQVPEADVARVLSVTPRTMRRRKKEGRRLRPEESDRLWLLVQVFQQAVETFGGEEQARRWLSEPHRLLAGEPPIGRLDTTAGADQVRYVLHQIEHSMPV